MSTKPTMTSSALNGVSFIRLDGEFDLASADELRQLGEAAITDHTSTLRIDMSGVTFADSTTLGALIRIANTARDRGCALILENPLPHSPESSTSPGSRRHSS